MHRVDKRIVIVSILALFFCGIASYSIAIRFTDFLLISRVDKLMLLGSIFGLFLLVTLLIFAPATIKVTNGLSTNTLRRSLLVSALAAITLMAAFYEIPAFPRLVTLEIKPGMNNLDARVDNAISINSITRYNPPNNTPTPISLADVSYEQGWLIFDNILTYHPTLEEGGSVRYTSYMQGRIVINFATGPGQGEVDLVINDDLERIDLTGATSGSVEKSISFPNEWEFADRTRKVFLAAGFLTDLLTLFFLISLLLIVLYQVLYKRNLRTRGLAPLATIFLVASAVIFLSDQAQKEVVFEDPMIEESVRSIIKNESDPIYARELLTIVELDLNGRGIQSLGGIESLRNLRVLNLRDNRISDISSLNRLLKLQELNLRGNQVVDISALAGLRKLVYLNLHSNSGITDISPLGNLTRLEKLILRNINIGDQTASLERLTRLTYLNVRNCSIEYMNFLATLMKQGALQDDQRFEMFATVNTLENPIVRDGSDPYEQVRPFWHKITYRYPYQLPYYPNGIAEPKFSDDEGFYEEEFLLTLSAPQTGGKIFYTLDGSEPAIDQNMEPTDTTYEYSTPILIKNRSSEPNVLSNIETSKIWSYYPPSPVFKGTVIRAMVVDGENQRSRIVTRSYFVDADIKKRYTLPVLSIVTPAEGLFDGKVGIYTPGDLYQDDHPHYDVYNTANYTQRGMEWERPASLELFTENGKVQFAQEVGIRISGNASRAMQQKSLRIDNREEYSGVNYISFDFFPNLNHRFQERNVSNYKTIVLRSGVKDVFLQSLLTQTQLDIQGAMPVIVFINGEYWGIYNIRTRYDKNYFRQYHDIDEVDLLTCEGRALAQIGLLYIGDLIEAGKCMELFSMIDENYIENEYKTVETLADPEIYQEISRYMDVENFIDFNITHIFTDNNDRQFYYWKYNGEPVKLNGQAVNKKDGRWRWMIMDLDQGFKNLGRYTLIHETEEGVPKTYLLRALLQNVEFKVKFINRFADMLNSIFREEVVLDRLESVHAEYSPAMAENIHRWGTEYASMEGWEKSTEELRQFALLRPDIQRSHIVDYFNLDGIASITLLTEPQRGYIRINSLSITTELEGVQDPAEWTGKYFQGVPVAITAVPVDGYRFSHWEGVNENQKKEEKLLIFPSQDMRIRALFVKDD